MAIIAAASDSFGAKKHELRALGAPPPPLLAPHVKKKKKKFTHLHVAIIIMLRLSMLRASIASVRNRSLSTTAPARLAFGDVPQPGDSKTKTVTVLPGHGIGPELMKAAMAVLTATGAPLAFEVCA